MGACDISFELKGKASKEQIEKAFKHQRENDSEENGHQSGYSGDFQTVNKVDCHFHTVFNSYNEAMEYCLKNAQKWDSVIAVYYKDAQCVLTKRETAKHAALSLEKVKLGEELSKLDNIPLNNSKAFQTCSGCKSRISLAHVKGVNCPVCRNSLRPKRLMAKMTAVSNKIQKITDKQNVIKGNALARAVNKCKDFKTLVAGWGAC